MKLLIALSAHQSWAPESILKKMANTVSVKRSADLFAGDYDLTKDRRSCFATVAAYIREHCQSMVGLSLTDRILMYGSRATLEEGEIAHVCLYSEGGTKRADTFAAGGGKPSIDHYWMPKMPFPDMADDNFNLVKTLTVKAFFAEYFTSTPMRGGPL